MWQERRNEYTVSISVVVVVFVVVPVVMLSSKDGVFDKARGRMVGAQDYLTKPFTKDQLLKAVQEFGVILQGAI